MNPPNRVIHKPDILRATEPDTLRATNNGIVRWKGSATVIAASLGGGAASFQFALVSECVNGTQLRVEIIAGGAIVGFGVKLGATSSDIEFEDSLSIPDAKVFGGAAKFSGAGAAIGDVGFGFGAIKLGQASSIGWGKLEGFDLSVFGGAGISTVTSVEEL